MKNHSVGFFDRLVAFVSYITAGWGGMIYCILMFIRKRTPSHFVRYNVFQSIFISLLYFVLAMAFNLIFGLLSHVPFLDYLIAQISYLFNRPLLADYSLIQILVLGLVVYMAVFSAFGKYPRVFWVSKIIDHAAN